VVFWLDLANLLASWRPLFGVHMRSVRAAGRVAFG
jgi:hypothetical protein